MPSYAFLTTTLEPELTWLSSDGFSSIRPTTLTGLAGLISSPWLAGVGPKNRHSLGFH